jgi:hypothetical protein
MDLSLGCLLFAILMRLLRRLRTSIAQQMLNWLEIASYQKSLLGINRVQYETAYRWEQVKSNPVPQRE